MNEIKPHPLLVKVALEKELKKLTYWTKLSLAEQEQLYDYSKELIHSIQNPKKHL